MRIISEKLQRCWPVLALTAAITIIAGIMMSGVRTTVIANVERQSQSKY
jgi:hypothetical protein